MIKRELSCVLNLFVVIFLSISCYAAEEFQNMSKSETLIDQNHQPHLKAHVWGSYDPLVFDEVNSYFKGEAQKIGTVLEKFYTDPTIYHWSPHAWCNQGETSINYGFDVSYLFNQNISAGLSLGVLQQKTSSGIWATTSSYAFWQYENSITSRLVPIMLGLEYSNNSSIGFVYGATLFAGVGIHSGEMKQTEFVNGYSSGIYTPPLVYHPSINSSATSQFSSLGFMFELAARLGYQFFKNIGVFGEVGYRYAPIRTELKNAVYVTDNSFSLGTEEKQEILFDFSGITYKLGVDLSL